MAFINGCRNMVSNRLGLSILRTLLLRLETFLNALGVSSWLRKYDLCRGIEGVDGCGAGPSAATHGTGGGPIADCGFQIGDWRPIRLRSGEALRPVIGVHLRLSAVPRWLSVVSSRSSVVSWGHPCTACRLQATDYRLPATGVPVLREIQPGVFAEEFEGLLVAGLGGFDLRVEGAEVETLALVRDLHNPLVAPAVDADEA